MAKQKILESMFRNVIAKQIAAADVTEDEKKFAWLQVMKISMFEENLLVLKQEFIPFLESFSKVFTELVNQTSYNLFGNKPSCCQGWYQTFRLSNMLFSSFIVVKFT